MGMNPGGWQEFRPVKQKKIILRFGSTADSCLAATKA